MPTSPMSFRFPPALDSLLRDQAERDGVTLTEVIRRAVVARDDLRRLTDNGARVVLVRDPEWVAPPGCVELHFIGGF